MEPWPHLTRAPITEALIDIRVELPPNVNLETLSAFRGRVSEHYPTHRTRTAWQGRIEFNKDRKPKILEPAGGPDGHLLTSRDGAQVVQARLDGFTFSRLKPYKDWEDLRNEARRLWNLYREIAQPAQITRIAVRYLNRLELPGPVAKYSHHMNTFPSIASALPSNLTGFLMQLEIPFTSPTATVLVTEALDRGDDRPIALILDIDAFRKEEISTDDPDLWTRLEELREIKNRVFFRSLTPETVELYK